MPGMTRLPLRRLYGGIFATTLLLGGFGLAVATAPPAGAAVPSVASLSPTNGLSAGGTVVTITGSDLASPTVTIGGATASVDSSESSSTQIVVTTPAGTPGSAVVAVTTSGGSANSSFTYDTDVPASWSSDPNTSCGTFTATPPANAETASLVLSGAGGGGGGIDESAGNPTGGNGALVTTSLTGDALDSPLTVETGCGGGAGVINAAFGWANNGSGGSGYGSGADGGAVSLTEEGSGGGGGGGASALCLGEDTCTTPVAVAGGGGGSGGERDCTGGDPAGSGGSGASTSQTNGNYLVANGHGGDTGDSGTGGGGGSAGAGGAGGNANADGATFGFSGGYKPPRSSGGVPGEATGLADNTPVSGGGGGGGGYSGGGGGGADACTATGILEVVVFTGGNGGGGGGAGASATYLADTSDTNFGTGLATGGAHNSGTNASATVTCSQDNNARVTSGCPGYVSLVYGVDPPPVVTSVVPNAGPLSGNTAVTVRGEQFHRGHSGGVWGHPRDRSRRGAVRHLPHRRSALSNGRHCRRHCGDSCGPIPNV